MRKVKIDLKASEEDKGKLFETNKRLKGAVSTLTKDWDTIRKLVSELYKEKEGLEATHASKVKELVMRVDTL